MSGFMENPDYEPSMFVDSNQAKELVEYRRKHGKIQSLKNFILLEEFPPEELERMGHYICFDDNSSAAAH